MTSVLLNAGGARDGGGGTWVLGVAEELARGGTRGLDWSFLVDEALAPTIRAVAPAVHVEPLPALGTARRTVWEQLMLARRPVDVLIGGGGYVPLARRAPTILVAHNMLHYRREWRGGSRSVVEALLGRRSAHHAAAIVAATDAMAGVVRSATRIDPVVLPFGPGVVGSTVAPEPAPVVLLHRTSWQPYKRLGDLLRALRTVATEQPGQLRLVTACDPHTAFARGHAESADDRALLADAVIRAHVDVEAFAIGSPAHRTLAGHVAVLTSPLESFSFPVAEAVGAGLPVIAADTPVARELCGPAGAWFFAPGDEVALTALLRRVLAGERPPVAPSDRAQRLSWAAHVDGLSELTRQVRTA